MDRRRSSSSRSLPFAVRAPWAFVANVFAFPLGLAGVDVARGERPAGPHPHDPVAAARPRPGAGRRSSSAATSSRKYAATPLAAGPVAHARRCWPWCFATMMCVASATRIGYVIYPLNFALWSWVCRGSAPAEKPVARLDRLRSSGRSGTSSARVAALRLRRP